MDKIDDKEEWVDYPYLGIGEKPSFGKNKVPTEEQIERMIG